MSDEAVLKITELLEGMEARNSIFSFDHMKKIAALPECKLPQELFSRVAACIVKACNQVDGRVIQRLLPAVRWMFLGVDKEMAMRCFYGCQDVSTLTDEIKPHMADTEVQMLSLEKSYKEYDQDLSAICSRVLDDDKFVDTMRETATQLGFLMMIEPGKTLNRIMNFCMENGVYAHRMLLLAIYWQPALVEFWSRVKGTPLPTTETDQRPEPAEPDQHAQREMRLHIVGLLFERTLPWHFTSFNLPYGLQMAEIKEMKSILANGKRSEEPEPKESPTAIHYDITRLVIDLVGAGNKDWSSIEPILKCLSIVIEAHGGKWALKWQEAGSKLRPYNFQEEHPIEGVKHTTVRGIIGMVAELQNLLVDEEQKNAKKALFEFLNKLRDRYKAVNGYYPQEMMRLQSRTFQRSGGVGGQRGMNWKGRSQRYTSSRDRGKGQVKPQTPSWGQGQVKPLTWGQPW